MGTSSFLFFIRTWELQLLCVTRPLHRALDVEQF
jgi:hypothetical protein